MSSEILSALSEYVELRGVYLRREIEIEKAKVEMLHHASRPHVVGMLNIRQGMVNEISIIGAFLKCGSVDRIEHVNAIYRGNRND